MTRIVLSLLLASMLVAPAIGTDCGRTSTGQIPLTDPNGLGLYAGGNARPLMHTVSGLAAADAVSGASRIVVVGIGMSVSKQAFARFMYRAKGKTAANVQLVNCGAGGATAESWSNLSDGAWSGCLSNLSNAGASVGDVRVVWMKLTRSRPSGPVEAFSAALLAEWRATLVNAAATFPNLQQVYVGSRSYGGYDDQGYNSEPYAWATGLAAKQVVQDSIENPGRPWVDWGPYFWTDGLTPRAGDALIWRCDPLPLKNGVPTYDAGDVKADGVHQTRNGEDKQAALLLNFFETDATTRWFTGR